MVDDRQAQARVQRIVTNIYRVANEQAGNTPEIAIVSGRPSAEAMEGRYVLVSESIVQLLEDDNELAIVLGHEIAHLVRGHTYGVQRETDVAAAAEHLSFDQSLIPGIENAVTQGLEAEADRYGLLYAALAGYDVSLAPAVYDKVLTNLPDVNHPPKEERQKNFQARLQNILDNVAVFNAGLDYALRGQYAFSIQAYENLLRDEFRSRDIYLNLGSFHHRLAFHYLKPENSPANICALSLELQSGFEPRGERRRSGQERGGPGSDETEQAKFREHLNQAIDKYQQALRASPGYAPAHNNLGCAYLHRQDSGDIYQAVGELERAANLEPTNALFANNLGVAYLGVDQREKAVAQFRRALQLKPDLAAADYNLGMALLSGNTPDSLSKARKALGDYLGLRGKSASDIYVLQARRRLGLAVEPSPMSTAPSANPASEAAQGLPLLPGQPVFQIPPDVHPDRTIKLIPEYDIELLLFPGWQLLVYDQNADEVTLTTNKFLTTGHVGVGSTMDDVHRIYGQADVEEARGDSRVVVYLEKGLIFRVQGNEIISWSVFLSHRVETGG